MNSENNRTLRERLKIEADEARERAVERERDLAVQQAFYESDIRPVLLKASEYFKEIVDDLNAIERPTTAFFPIGPSGDRDVAFTQDDYQFYADDPAQPTQVSVTCRCVMVAPTTRYARNAFEADELERLLRSMGVVFHRRRQNDLTAADSEKSRFVMEGSITAGFNLNARADKRAVEILTRNLEVEPQTSHLLQPENVQESLFEALGELLLRERKHLFKRSLDPSVREKLRAQAAERRAERARIEAEAMAMRPESSSARLWKAARRVGSLLMTELRRYLRLLGEKIRVLAGKLRDREAKQ